MFLDVCNTSFLTKKCPQSCIQNYWQMFMNFCPILVVHINSCLRLKFFYLFSSSLTFPYLLHLSLSSESPHLSLFCPPSASFSLTPSPFTLHISLSIPPSSYLTSPSPPLLQLSSPFFYFDRLCQPLRCICGGGRTCRT